MTARPSDEKQLRHFEIAIVGNDLLLEALPGRPLQVAHAIHACGYDLVVPVSWGEELVALHVLDELTTAGQRALIFAACPKVRSRLMASGPELLPHLLPCIAPPAAAARYLRALEPDVRMRITYIGACPGAADTSIDVRIAPADFLAHLEKRSISILDQPLVYESVIPPDRRRHASLPGGMPAPDGVTQRGFQFAVLRDGDEISAEIAQHLIASERVLLDMAPSVGCPCAGFVSGGSRDAVIALEPPRSTLPVIDRDVHVALELPLPAAIAPRVPEEPHDATADQPQEAGGAPEDATLVAGVHSIEAAARRRAERLRIAVTPPSVRATPASRVGEPTSAKGQGREAPGPTEVTAEATPGAARVARPELPPPVIGGPEAVTSEGAGQAPLEHMLARPDIGTTPAEPAPEPEAREPGASGTAAERPEPESPPPSTPVVVRRRTPVYEIWHASRTTVRQRVVAKEGTTVPRAYHAVRHRSGSFVAIPTPAAPEVPAQQAPEIPAPVVQGPAAVTPAGPAGEIPTDLVTAPRRSRRRDPRRVEAAGPSRSRRLVDLLMAIILIAALVVTLFVISRGWFAP